MLMLQEGPPTRDNSDRGLTRVFEHPVSKRHITSIKGTGMDTPQSFSMKVMTTGPFCVSPSVPK